MNESIAGLRRWLQKGHVYPDDASSFQRILPRSSTCYSPESSRWRHPRFGGHSISALGQHFGQDSERVNQVNRLGKTSRWRLVVCLLLMALVSPASAQVFCVFDILGNNGPLFAAMKEFALQARAKGANIDLRAYVDEQVAAEDFKAGQCDAVLLTGVRARQFNPAVGSIDSVGALAGYPQLELLLQTLARPQQSGLMQSGPYEVGGILPLGAAYLFLRDRRIDSVAKMAGRKMVVLDYDRAQWRMAERIGAQAVAADVTTFAGKFNNGLVDLVAAPAVAYMPLELYKGVGTHGVVVKLPVAMLTFQIILRKESFPQGFGQFSRDYFLTLFDPTMKVIRAAESQIMFFYPPPDGDAEKYQAMMREARISLTQEGIYDKRMMTIMKRVRCHLDRAAAECSDNRE